MIYLFNKDEKLIKIIRKSAIKVALQKFGLTTDRYVSDRLTVETKLLDDKTFNEVEYMAIQSIDNSSKFHYFYIAQKRNNNNTTELLGVQSGIEELLKTIVYDKRPNNQTARTVINDLLANTNWTIGYLSDNGQYSTNFYYCSVFEALQKVCEVWHLEMQFFVEIDGNKIAGRHIDFKHKIGTNTGKRVVYGHNALEIVKEVERTNIYTALVGRGKGEEVSHAGDIDENGQAQQADGYGRKITFEDVVWDKSKGYPVDKPKGQKYVELKEMTALYGIKTTDGKFRPKIGIVDFEEEEDTKHLLQLTYEKLLETSRPQVTFKTTSAYIKGAGIGDTIRVVRHDKGLYYQTRIFELEIDRLNNKATDITLGDNLASASRQSMQAIANSAVDQFIQNEFTNVMNSVNASLPSADGFGHTWYTATDPRWTGKVIINDLWFKPDPEYEGFFILYRWDGKNWEEMLRSHDSDKIKKEIEAKLDEIDKKLLANEQERDQQISELYNKASVNSDLIAEAKKQTESVKNSLNETKDSLLSALNQTNSTLSNYQQTNSANLSEIKQISSNLDNKISVNSTLINQQADEIKKRLTSAQVTSTINNSLNNYYTISQTQNLVSETATGFTRQISETKDLIPSSSANNMLLKSNVRYTNAKSVAYTLAESMVKGRKYTIVADYSITGADVAFMLSSSETSDGTEQSGKIYWNASVGRTLVTFTANANVAKGKLFRLVSTNSDIAIKYVTFATLVEGPVPLTRWRPAFDELATVTSLNSVKDTVDSHTQTIQSNTNKISQVIQTADGLVSRVADLSNTSTANMLLKSNVRYTNAKSVAYTLAESMVKGRKYTIVADYSITGADVAFMLSSSETSDGTEQSGKIYWNASVGRTLVTFTANANVAKGKLFRLVSTNSDIAIKYVTFATLVEGPVPLTRWRPAFDELASSNDLKATQTLVAQTANSWAVKTLTGSGSVLSQLNLNADGSVKIDGKLVRITGQTIIDNAVIKSSNIASINADKITTGTLNASNVNIVNLNANNITSGTLNAKYLSGGIITSLNGETTIDLDSGTITSTSYNNNLTFINNGEFGKAEKVVLNKNGLNFYNRSGYDKYLFGFFNAYVDKNYERHLGVVSPHNNSFIFSSSENSTPMIGITPDTNSLEFYQEHNLIFYINNQRIVFNVKNENINGVLGFSIGSAASHGVGVNRLRFLSNGKIEIIKT